MSQLRVIFSTLALSLTASGCTGTVGQDGTVVVLLSAASPQMSSGGLQIHSNAGWQPIGHFSGVVPAAPRAVEGASVSLPSGGYDSVMVGRHRVALDVTVAPGVVEPVLLGMTGDHPDPTEAYAGQQSVNVGLRELAGRYPRVPDVQLEDQHGDALPTSRWTGGITVLAAFQDSAPAAQQATLALFAQLHRKLPAARLVEVTTNPPRDTPAVLADFARRHPIGWSLATGTAAAVQAVLAAMGAAPDTGGTAQRPVLDLVDAHRFVLRHFIGVPTESQVADAAATLQSSIAQPSVNRPEPAFALAAWNGTTLRPGSFGGKALVVNFWASWCAPCRTEMPLLQQAAAHNPGIAFLFVDERDNQTAARAFFTALGLHGDVAADADGTAAALFDVVSVPYTVFVSATGTIVGVQIGQMDSSTLNTHLAELTQ